MAQMHSGFIIVRLSRRLDAFVKQGSDLRALALEAGATDLVSLLDAYPECRAERVVSSVPTDASCFWKRKPPNSDSPGDGACCRIGDWTPGGPRRRSSCSNGCRRLIPLTERISR